MSKYKKSAKRTIKNIKQKKICKTKNTLSGEQITSSSTYSINSDYIFPIIYVTEEKTMSFFNTNPIDKGCSGDFFEYSQEEIKEYFAPIFVKAEHIYIPKKLEYNLNQYVQKRDLKKINRNPETAKEMCLVFVSNLSSTYFTEEKYKPLHSDILHEQLKDGRDNTYNYKNIIYVLKKGTEKKGAVIEVQLNDIGTESYEVGQSSKQYRISSTYLDNGLICYLLKDKKIIEKRERFINDQLRISSRNVICRNLFDFYKIIELPSIEVIQKSAKQLVSNNHYTKKVKKLTFRNRHSNNHWKNPEKRSFVEDNIELFNYLTENGFMIPIEGMDNSGRKVVDSLNLMPSWIRKLITINGLPICEIVYRSFHPNIAVNIYRGSGKHINHEIVSNYLGIDQKLAKIEHLSFFNKRIDDMKKSPLFQFYVENEPILIENLIEDKRKYGYKKTSQRLFAAEVEIMTEVIKRLNERDIYVGYIYDALICEINHICIVENLMNTVVKEFGVNTHV